MKIAWRRLTLGALGAALPLLAPAAGQAALKSQSFSVPGQHPFVVPPAVHTLLVKVVGAHGGAGSDEQAGGAGGTVTAVLAVQPGEKLFAEVGGNGFPGVNTLTGGLGGYNGGGEGGSQMILFGSTLSGGGGGGASDIRTVPACSTKSPDCGSLASRLVVAGGGGGGGGNSTQASGGIGGAADADGLNGSQDNYADAAGGGGLRGTLIAGGAGGGPADGPPGTAGNSSPGAVGQGGDGALGIGGGGGGGGGGIYGGGGGGSGQGQLIMGNTMLVSSGGAGAGGGSSSQPPGPKGVTNLSLRPTPAGAQPVVELLWKLPIPTVRTVSPTALRAISATLRGTLNPNAAPVATCHFTILPATALGSIIPCAQQVHVGIVPVPVSARVAGLKPHTKYRVRLVATNAQGTARGKRITFTTPRRRRH